MTTLVRAILCTALAIGCGPYWPESAAEEVRYELSDEVLVNPERGFYEQFTAGSEGEPLAAKELQQLRKQGISLLLRLYYLEKFRDSEFSPEQLELIATDFRTIRESGCKCILRFAYSRNLGQPDAPLDFVLKHIEQLKPLLLDNADVIAVLQAGFIGAWGEWHGSTNGLETDDAMRAIAGSLLDALPATRCVQVRTPRYKRMIVGSDAYLTEETAFKGTPHARLGHHNDCFLADATDVGTYDPARLEWDKQHVAHDSRFVPMGGETCQPSQFTEYQPARAELARMHWTYLNRGFNRRVISQWKKSGLYAEAEKLLGYRLALLSGDCDQTTSTGETWTVQLKFKNLGWAAPINPHDVCLLLKSQDGSSNYQAKLPVEIRGWLPGEDIAIRSEVGIPQDLPAGNYNLYLKISDPANGLENRVEYMIQLANQGLWDQRTGLHDLKHKVTLLEDGRKATQNVDVWFEAVEGGISDSTNP